MESVTDFNAYICDKRVIYKQKGIDVVGKVSYFRVIDAQTK